jgi:hypothetical protein
LVQDTHLYVRDRIESIFKNLPKEHRFGGIDILNAISSLLELSTEEPELYSSFEVAIKASELVDIVLDEEDDWTQPAARLRDEYPYIVVQITVTSCDV